MSIMGIFVVNACQKTHLGYICTILCQTSFKIRHLGHHFRGNNMSSPLPWGGNVSVYDIKLTWQVQWHVTGCFVDAFGHFPKPCWRDVLLHVSLSLRPVWVFITATAYVEVIHLAEQDSITEKWKQTAGLWQVNNPAWKDSSSTLFFQFSSRNGNSARI